MTSSIQLLWRHAGKYSYRGFCGLFLTFRFGMAVYNGWLHPSWLFRNHGRKEIDHICAIGGRHYSYVRLAQQRIISIAYEMRIRNVRVTSQYRVSCFHASKVVSDIREDNTILPVITSAVLPIYVSTPYTCHPLLCGPFREATATLTANQAEQTMATPGNPFAYPGIKRPPCAHTTAICFIFTTSTLGFSPGPHLRFLFHRL